MPIGKEQPRVHLFKQISQKVTATVRRLSANIRSSINLSRYRHQPASGMRVGLARPESACKKPKSATAAHYAASLRTTCA